MNYIGFNIRLAVKRCGFHSLWGWLTFFALLCVGLTSRAHRLVAQRAHHMARPPIVIGASNVMSGPARFLGIQLIKGSQTYFDLINVRGGIYGRQLRLRLQDDRYEPDAAVRNTNAFIQSGDTFFLFDYVGTPTLTRVLPLLKYYEGRHIVNVAPFTGADPQRKPPYDKFVFNIRASYREETRTLVRYLYAKGHRRIGFLGQADAYGKSGEIGV